MVDKSEKSPAETPGDLIVQCHKYMDDFSELFKMLPDQVTAIDPEDKKPQKRKKQKVSLVQMEANIVKQREALAKKRKAEKEAKAEQQQKSESTEESKEAEENKEEKMETETKTKKNKHKKGKNKKPKVEAMKTESEGEKEETS